MYLQYLTWPPFTSSFCSYIKTLEWILIYSTVPVKFHVITNEASAVYVEKIIEKINMTSNCDFSYDVVHLSSIIDRANKDICPILGTRQEFCEVLMGNMTPLLFPYLFPDLDHAIYVDRSLVFQVSMRCVRS